MNTLKSYRSFFALLVCGSIVALLGCGEGGVEASALPDASVAQDTAVVVHFDAESMNPDNLRAAAMALLDAVPEESAQQREMAVAEIDKNLAEYRTLYDDMVERGAEAMTMAIAVTGGGPEEGALLVRTRTGADLGQIREAINTFSTARGDSMPEEVTLERLDDSWAYFTGDDELVSPEGGSAEVTESFRQALDDVPGGMKLAFRMTEAIKAEFAGESQNAPPMLIGLMGPMQQLDFAVIGVTTGASPTATAQMRFADEQSAGAFLQAWNGLIQMGKGMAQGQLAQMPNPPSNDAINGLFDALSMTQDGGTLSMSLDQQFVQSVGEIAPAAMPMIMGGLGGGMGPGGPGGMGGGGY